MENYYKILDVDENSTAEDIKKSYRSLASKHHPDKGGDTATFQKIQQAYSVLGDQEKRKEYDFLRNNQHSGFRFTGENFNSNFDPFGEIFGFNPEHFFRQKTTQRKNRNIKITLTISLEETLDKIEKILELNFGNENKTVKIDLPRGVKSHSTFKYTGLGDRTLLHFPPGDLLVDVVIADNKKFQPMGNDLITTISIDCFDAMLGSVVKIEGLDGKELEFNINPGTQPGAKYKLKGQGLYVPGSSIRGDLLVVVELTVKKYNEKEINLIKTIKSKLDEN